MSFALTMSVALGVLAPLGYSVFTAAGSAVLLGAVTVPHAARVPSAAQIKVPQE